MKYTQNTSLEIRCQLWVTVLQDCIEVNTMCNMTLLTINQGVEDIGFCSLTGR